MYIDVFFFSASILRSKIKHSSITDIIAVIVVHAVVEFVSLSIGQNYTHHKNRRILKSYQYYSDLVQLKYRTTGRDTRRAPNNLFNLLELCTWLPKMYTILFSGHTDNAQNVQQRDITQLPIRKNSLAGKIDRCGIMEIIILPVAL